MQQICKIHGLTDYSTTDRSRCKKCIVDAVTKRRQKIKLMSLEYKGNKCEICGYNKCLNALHFHHKDPNQKLFGIGEKGYTRAWELVKQELDKCQLLCANCHAEQHYQPN